MILDVGKPTRPKVVFYRKEDYHRYSEKLKKILLHPSSDRKKTDQTCEFLNGVLKCSSALYTIDDLKRAPDPLKIMKNAVIPIDISEGKEVPFTKVPVFFQSGAKRGTKRLVTLPKIPENARLFYLWPPLWIQFCTDGILITNGIYWCRQTSLKETDHENYKVVKHDGEWYAFLPELRHRNTNIVLSGLYWIPPGKMLHTIFKNTIPDNTVVVTLTPIRSEYTILEEDEKYCTSGFSYCIKKKLYDPVKIETENSILHAPAVLLQDGTLRAVEMII